MTSAHNSIATPSSDFSVPGPSPAVEVFPAVSSSSLIGNGGSWPSWLVAFEASGNFSFTLDPRFLFESLTLRRSSLALRTIRRIGMDNMDFRKTFAILKARTIRDQRFRMAVIHRA